MSKPVDNQLTAGDVSVGDTAPQLVVEDLERKDFVKYAGASGDFFPIHYDEPFAKSAGNPSVFGQGMFTGGVVSAMVNEWFGLEHVTRFRVRFESRVWPGDTVTVDGEIVDVDDADPRIVDADIMAVNQDDELLISGSVTAELPD